MPSLEIMALVVIYSTIFGFFATLGAALANKVLRR